MAKKGDIWYPDRVEGGSFTTRSVLQLIRSFEGKQVQVAVRESRNFVSHPQRGFYHGIVIRLITERLHELGAQSPRGGPITDQEVHDMMRGRFLRKSILIGEDEYEDVILSTTEITAGRMTEYIEDVRRWAKEHLDIEVPDPNTQVRLM